MTFLVTQPLDAPDPVLDWISLPRFRAEFLIKSQQLVPRWHCALDDH
jgi:hypothetical protein